MATDTFICFMADDLGMHPAVNDGIATAFSEGLLTDSNLMACCPAIDEGIAVAKQLALPVGMHVTATCDWDLYRWGPITDAPSLCDHHGFLQDSAEAAWAVADEAEARAEFQAQIDRLLDAGLSLTHIGEHMSRGDGPMTALMDALGWTYDLPWKRCDRDGSIGFRLSFDFRSEIGTSNAPSYAVSKQRLLDWIDRLEPGYHLSVSHPAIDCDELDTLCSPDFPARNWARFFRANDLKLLCDPEIAERLAARDIATVPISQVPRIRHS